MKSTSNLLIGYVTPRQFGPFSMPVPAQNSCLREYASSNGFSYGLPQCEHIFEGSYVQFFGTLNTVENGSNIAMYSQHMLPQKEKDLKYTENLITKKRLKIHFVLEKNIFEDKQFLINLKKLFVVSNTTKLNYKNLKKLNY